MAGHPFPVAQSHPASYALVTFSGAVHQFVDAITICLGNNC